MEPHPLRPHADTPAGGNGSADPRSAAPPVVAVVVACDPGPWFEEGLASLAAQDYPNLSVLVVDVASRSDVTGRVAEILPGAYVRTLPQRVGFGRAANEALTVVAGASHFLLCHDDVALAPDAVRLLVEEAYRSNAGMVVPKLVSWEDATHLLSVGASADRVGVVHSLVERGELDQGQHDAVRDVFVAPGAATLVRADLFRALGGYRPDVDQFGEDLDLSWRAQVAGARILVAPSARVRHREAQRRGERAGWGSHTARRRAAGLAEQHRVRTLLTCYGLLHLTWMLPTALVYLLGEALTDLVSGRPGEAGRLVEAFARGFGHPGRVWHARRAVQRHRNAADGDLRRLQSRGNARLRAYLRARFAEGTSPQPPLWSDREGVPRGAPAGAVAEQPPARSATGVVGWRTTLVVALVLAAIVAFGTRSLFGKELPAVGLLPDTSAGWGSLWRSWWSTWQPGGLGVSAPSSPALALLGLLATVLFGAVGTLQHVVVLGPLVVGPIGAYRAARWWGSGRGRLVALVVYATVPLAYNALANGDWPGLLAYAAAPWILERLCRLSGDVPFPRARAGQLAGRVLGLGIIVALVGSAAPSFVFVVVAVGAALLVGSALAGRGWPGVRALAVSVAAAAVAVVLLAPWSFDVLHSRAAAVGLTGGPAARLGLGQVLRFDTGPVGTGSLEWALLAAAALPLVIGRTWRLAWAARLWLVALACAGLAWAGARGWMPAPPPEVLLAPAAAALAGSAALGTVAFELDLPGYRFGWRQLSAALAGVAVVVAAVPMLAASGGGRWHVPTAGAGSVLTFLPGPSHGDYRVLWVGAPAALPLAGRALEPGVAYGASFDGLPGTSALWTTSAAGATPLLADDLRQAEGRMTTKLGHLLAPMAVRYLVVPRSTAPAGAGGHAVPVPGRLLDGLRLQTDLQVLNVDPDYVVYRNAAWAPARAVLPPGAAPAARAPTVAAANRLLQQTSLRGAPPVLTGEGPAGSGGPVPGGRSILVSATRDTSWRLHAGGRTVASQPAFGWAMRFDVPAGAGGPARLDAPPATGTRIGQGIEVALWAAAVALVVLDLRRRRRGGTPPETVRAEWFEPMSPGTGHGAWRRPSRSLGAEDLEGDEVWLDV